MYNFSSNILQPSRLLRIFCIFGHRPCYKGFLVFLDTIHIIKDCLYFWTPSSVHTIKDFLYFWTPSILSRIVCIFGHHPCKIWSCLYFWTPSIISKIICILDTILISRVVCIFGHHPYYQRLFVFWTPSMLSRTVCIFGHQPYYEDYFCQYFWKPVSRAFQKCIICPFFAFFIIFTLFAK